METEYRDQENRTVNVVEENLKIVDDFVEAFQQAGL